MAKKKLTDEEQTAKAERVRKERLEKAIRQFEEYGTESKGAGVVVKEAINKAKVALVGDVRINESSFDVADYTIEVRQAFAINATVYIRLRMGSFSDAVRADDGRTFTPLNPVHPGGQITHFERVGTVHPTRSGPLANRVPRGARARTSQGEWPKPALPWRPAQL
jgi:hypothetical protein